MKEKKELTQKEKDILTIIIALLVLVVFLGYSLYNNYTKAKREAEVSHEITLVTDNSRYFTVINAINRYLSTVQGGNKEDILLLLNEEYKSKFMVTDSNVSNFIPSLDKDGLYNYKGAEMYQKKISKNVTEFYVHGEIIKSIMDEDDEAKDYNLTVVLYEDKLLFSVYPGVAK